MSNAMIVGPFALMPGKLVIHEMASIERWEEFLPQLFMMQKYAPWWLGDAVNFGEARFGDVFWQSVPMDASQKMIERFASISRKIPPEERVLSLSWTHHVTALRVEVPAVRRALLRKAENECLDTEQFSKLVRSY